MTMGHQYVVPYCDDSACYSSISPFPYFNCQKLFRKWCEIPLQNVLLHLFFFSNNDTKVCFAFDYLNSVFASDELILHYTHFYVYQSIHLEDDHVKKLNINDKICK